MTIQRLVLDFRGEGGDLLVRCLYRTQDGPWPNRLLPWYVPSSPGWGGLTQALETLDGGAEYVGTSGYAIREDVLLAISSPDALETLRQVKEGAA
jgi:hypothetical protein